MILVFVSLAAIVLLGVIGIFTVLQKSENDVIKKINNFEKENKNE